MRVPLIVLAGLAGLLVVSAMPRWLHAPVELPKLSRAQKVLDVCPPVVARGWLGDPRRLDEWRVYSGMWQEMGEPPLACGPSNADETYRVTWLHSFVRFDLVVVRIGRSGTRATVSGSVFRWVPKGSGIAQLSRIYRGERTVTEAEWTQMVEMIERADFWNWGPPPERGVLDGDVWVIEGRRRGGYQFVKDQVPPEESSFRRIGLSLMRLAGVRPKLQ
jgi:hypothetical protein